MTSRAATATRTSRSSARQVTPNHHALAERFALLDHVYANSEASIDGHFWTSAAKVSDYVHKNWNQNYGGRNRPYDFGVYAVTWPGNGFIFDQLERQGISWFNFGEAVAGVSACSPTRTAPPRRRRRSNAKFAKSDLGVPFPAELLPQRRLHLQERDRPEHDVGRLAAGRRSRRTPSRASTASSRSSRPGRGQQRPGLHLHHAAHGPHRGRDSGPSDAAGATWRTTTTGSGRSWTPISALVDLESSSAIFVIEDDSQDGADHVDAHRIPAFVISPYAKRGAVVHTRYDFLSVIRSMELILGMKPLGLFDALATPMYDAFTRNPDNGDPYAAISPTWPLNERNANTTANQRLAGGLQLPADRPRAPARARPPAVEVGVRREQRAAAARAQRRPGRVAGGRSRARLAVGSRHARPRAAVGLRAAGARGIRKARARDPVPGVASSSCSAGVALLTIYEPMSEAEFLRILVVTQALVLLDNLVALKLVVPPPAPGARVAARKPQHGSDGGGLARAGGHAVGVRAPPLAVPGLPQHDPGVRLHHGRAGVDAPPRSSPCWPARWWSSPTA